MCKIFYFAKYIQIASFKDLTMKLHVWIVSQKYIKIFSSQNVYAYISRIPEIIESINTVLKVSYPVRPRLFTNITSGIHLTHVKYKYIYISMRKVFCISIRLSIRIYQIFIFSLYSKNILTNSVRKVNRDAYKRGELHSEFYRIPTL